MRKAWLKVSERARRANGGERNNLDQDEVHSVKIVFQIEIFFHLRTSLESCQQVLPSCALLVAAGDQRTSVVHGAPLTREESKRLVHR